MRLILGVLALGLAVAALAGAQPAAADGTWGTSGAQYTGGILCQLGSAQVPLAQWTVNGTTSAYSTADVVHTGTVYGPAPTTGAQAAIRPGQAGLTATDIGALAYLIDHTSGSAADVAETSAYVALAAGHGEIQSQCLGQQGTSAGHATARYAAAQRYAGPYKVTVSAPTSALAGASATVTARVDSAAGNPTPGIGVTFDVGGQTSSATTGSNGQARASVTAAIGKATPITAQITEPTSLVYFATNPAAVTLGAPSTATGTGTLPPAPQPKPVVTASADRLLIDGVGTTPVADVQGVFGYSGDGSITLAGPVPPGTGKTCAALRADDFASAPEAWTGGFTFTGDGPQRAGASPGLRPGCYAVSAQVSITDSVPRLTARSAFDPGQVVTVSALTLTESTGGGVAPPSALSATLAAAHAGAATVSSTLGVYGPVQPRSGSCTGTDWTHAAALPGSTDAVALTAPRGTTGDADTLTARLTAPKVTATGCYALRPRSVVSQGGLRLTVEPVIGDTGSTTLVVTPTVQIRTSTYAGLQGKAMTGTVTIGGAYRFAGTVAIGLRAAAAIPVTGCRDATFPLAVAAGAQTTVASTGDGTYTFRSPVPSQSACYAVTATLTLTANPAVRSVSPAPSDESVFLAAAAARKGPAADAARHDDNGTARVAIAFGIALLLILGICVAIGVRAFTDAGSWDEFGEGWFWRPRQPRPGSDARPGPQPVPE